MIKNFIYLDEYKMYSLSSQIFEGITEYLVSTSHHEKGEEDNQKGPLGSGRILADIIKKGYKTEEKKYLQDYSYTLFENHLIEQHKVADINTHQHKDGNVLDFLSSYSFIKVTGKATLQDMESIRNAINNHNRLGKALARMQIQSEGSSRGRTVEKLAKTNGLHLDDKFVKDLEFLLSYGFGDQLEVQILHDKYLFSSNLKREYLRENENLLIKKYARHTEKEFTIFGIVTQFQENNNEYIEDNETDTNIIKIALMKLVSQLTGVETSFFGKLKNEIMIDPIAIYTEL